MNLDELAEKYDTDKGPSHHTYTSRYSLYLDSFRDLSFNFLEIGVFTGSSLKMWNEFFSNATIIGVDIDPTCSKFENNRTHIHIGDQTDVSFLKSIHTKYGHIDVIVDDGGHSWKQQIITFETLFPLLTPGGLYFVEDMHTSYRRGSIWDDYDITGIDYFKNLVDDVNINGKSFCGYKEVSSSDLNYFEKNIDYIHFYKSLIVISKKAESL